VRGVKLGPITVGKVGDAVACLAAAVTLAVAGYAHQVVGLTGALGFGAKLGSAPSAGPMNILVMGLESRTTSNIVGFYELSQQFGGLEVCIQPAPAQGGLPARANLTDSDPLTGTDNSGFNAYRDGYNAK